MVRWPSIAAVLLLAGCVSTSTTEDAPETESGSDVASDVGSRAPGLSPDLGGPQSAGAYLPPGLLEAVYLGGTGQALILRWPDAVTVVGTTGEAGLSPDVDDPLASTLRALGIRHVDALVILGTGAWREGGCPALFEAVTVGRVYHPGTSKDASADHPCLVAASAQGSDVLTARELDAGDLLPLSAHATVTLLAPNAVPDGDGFGQMALRIGHGSVSMLLAGDLGCSGEGDLLASGADVDVDLVLEGFPGGDDGGCPGWLDATSPEVVLVADDRRIAPSANLRSRLAATADLVLSPGPEGHLFDSDGASWSLKALVREAPPETAAAAPGSMNSSAPQVRITLVVHQEVPTSPEGFNEWVELRNFGRQGADLTGWTLRHPDGAVFHFPTGTSLAPDMVLRVHTGNCDPEETDVCWGRHQEVWGGEGMAMLFDRNVMIDSHHYAQ